MAKLKQTAFYLTEELIKAVSFKAAQDGIDKSTVVRKALEVYLADVILSMNLVEDELARRDEEKEKRSRWGYGLGWANMDGVTHSPEFLTDVDKEARGEISMEQVRKGILQRHDRTRRGNN